MGHGLATNTKSHSHLIKDYAYMANFNTHVAIAAVAGTGTAIATAAAHLIDHAQIPWLVFLSVIGGMLPDIDANNSKPVRLLFNILGLMAAYVVLQSVKDRLLSYQVLTFAAAAYLLVRYGVFALFNSLTDHRGVFHSLLAALFFALLATCISHYLLRWGTLDAWLNGVFIGIGFIVHLLLDECYSVNLANARMKKSFGTALKPFSYASMSASLLMLACTLALFWMAPPATPLLKAFKTLLA